MRRRDCIKVIVGSIVATGQPAARAQDADRIYRIAVLSLEPRTAARYVAFFDELRKLGFEEGRNLIVDGRGFDARSGQFADLAATAVAMVLMPVPASIEVLV
jgi:hypothetical protein